MRRRVFGAGIGLFTLASLAGGLSTSAGILLAARRNIEEGAGGALAAPAVLALIVSGFAEGRERTRALGIYKFPLLMPKEFASFGAIDATRSLAEYDELPFAVEWETGNISSSHRSVNKMVRDLQAGVLSGAVLVVPTPDFAYFLTERIGNIRELLPYVHMWRSVTIALGYLSILTIKHDYVSEDVPKIPKLTRKTGGS